MNNQENNVRFTEVKSNEEEKAAPLLWSRLRGMERACILEAMRREEKEKLLKEIQLAIDTKSFVVDVDQVDENQAVLKPTSPYAFRMKPCTIAVHQALQFFAAWNWMISNEVANAQAA